MKFLEAQGVPRERIIDGRVFKVPELNFPRLLAEGVAYGTFDKESFEDQNYVIYPRVYAGAGVIFQFGKKSYIAQGQVDGWSGIISVDKFSSLAHKLVFKLGQNYDHNYRNLNNYALGHFDWGSPQEFFPPQGVHRILIGNDVWIGSGSNLKCTNPNKPLVIGDGAVIASDSVVVKNVPPYAIVGGNPAQVIKYRFSEEVIAALLRIKWWDWSLDKIHDNFRYFNDVEKFISLHDKQR